eukprot:COSAG06_NODE_545_length_14448_cov_25.465747_2_plen_245_part_00
MRVARMHLASWARPRWTPSPPFGFAEKKRFVTILDAGEITAARACYPPVPGGRGSSVHLCYGYYVVVTFLFISIRPLASRSSGILRERHSRACCGYPMLANSGPSGDLDGVVSAPSLHLDRQKFYWPTREIHPIATRFCPCHLGSNLSQLDLKYPKKAGKWLENGPDAERRHSLARMPKRYQNCARCRFRCRPPATGPIRMPPARQRRQHPADRCSGSARQRRGAAAAAAPTQVQRAPNDRVQQ